MKKIGSWMILAALLVSSPVFARAEEIVVAAAANVQYPLEELKTAFEAATGITVKTIIGSSGKLTAQIENGAPFDVFLSADMEYPEALFKKGLAGEPKVYVYGTLVLWTLTNADIADGVKALGRDQIKKIAIANPETAPYGKQAVNALKFHQIYEAVEPKLVFGESISQVNSFVATQAADAGFTAKSAVLSPDLKEKGKWVEVDPKSYSPIAQGAAIVKRAESVNAPAAQKFYDYIFSAQAREVFEKYGYIAVNKLKGKIAGIESSESMSIVEVDVSGDIFSSIVLETPQSAAYLKAGGMVTLLFKETEVSIAKNLSGMISLRNRVKSKVTRIERGQILSKVVLQYKNEKIVSVISTRSADRLALKEGDEVEWLVKTNEISLSKGAE